MWTKKILLERKNVGNMELRRVEQQETTQMIASFARAIKHAIAWGTGASLIVANHYHFKPLTLSAPRNSPNRFPLGLPQRDQQLTGYPRNKWH
jgi:hypothetical protein